MPACKKNNFSLVVMSGNPECTEKNILVNSNYYLVIYFCQKVVLHCGNKRLEIKL